MSNSNLEEPVRNGVLVDTGNRTTGCKKIDNLLERED